nr:hypothetical protein [Ancylobacter gelatini]
MLPPLLVSGGAPVYAQSIGPAGGVWSGPAGAPAPGPYAPYEQPPARRGGDRMDGDAAAQMLRARGFSNIKVLRQRGATILLEANGPRGERVQVVVDSASGAISGMKVIGFGDKRY